VVITDPVTIDGKRLATFEKTPETRMFQTLGILKAEN